MNGVKVHGLKQTQRKLRSLDRKIRSKVVTKFGRAGAAPITREVRRTAPRDTKALKENVRAVIRKYPRRGVVMAIIGVLSKKNPKTGRRPSKYLHLVEKGTRPHVIIGVLRFRDQGQQVVTRSVQHPGAKPSRFMEKAARKTERKAIGAFTRKYRSEVESEARKLKRVG